MVHISGTHLKATFSRVVDGDTIKVFLPGSKEDESLRILCLDTEESRAGGNKPVTPLGKKAKERAQQFFANATEVIIEFPGNDPLELCMKKYRGNYGRLLVYVYLDGIDFQEVMIREGYSPYFMKYGNAVFHEHHQRYVQAELVAQSANIGVWDQMTSNQAEMRNYAALSTWWRLRARVIDEYRALKAAVPSLLNTRLDYQAICDKAKRGERATLFTELSYIRRVGSEHGLISYGSEERPFNLFIPEMNSDNGQWIVQLLMNRYISQSEDHPRRSYAYVSGELSLYKDKPQMVITSVTQISDDLATTENGVPQQTRLSITALLANPEGEDSGRETVTLKNYSAQQVSIDGWLLRDRAGRQITLSGIIDGNQQRVIPLPANKLILNNAGDEVMLLDSLGNLHCRVSYTGQDVQAGHELHFEF
jgi:micrococcal nuclease